MAPMRSTTTASSSTSTTPSTANMNYHVFLSFRGEDTRKNFTDHLYAALQRKGIVTFRDEEELGRGEVISAKLEKAIEESLFAIVIFSKDYASSSWCLDELLKIVECKRDLPQSVFPVFCGVDPSDLRNQNGNIGIAFEKHEEKFTGNEEKVRRWREALMDVASLSGWDTRDKYEAGIVEEIAETIWTKLRVKLPPKFDHLIGIQSKVDTLMSLLKIELQHKCFIGISGMGGIGKTTLAEVVYAKIRDKFYASCFLTNVRENSESGDLVFWQKKLLSCLHKRHVDIDDLNEGVKIIRQFFCKKKVLIVLDDVTHISQLDYLVGSKDWFGPGSKIIVTTRNSRLLTAHDQFEMYEMKLLERNDSLKLFCRQAFKEDCPQEGFEKLSESVVEYASDLPLALKVLGSLLRKRSEFDEWRDMLDKLKQSLHQDIFNPLCKSFDGLEDKEYKTTFLDIACFFNWKEKDEVINILKSFGLYPTIGIQVLTERSLLSKHIEDSISRGKRERVLYMHDLLQEMGRNIVLQESTHAHRRSRLWCQEEIDLVLKENKGTENIQCIVLNIDQPYKATWHPDCFSKMDNLRFLDLSNVHLSNRLNSLPKALKVLRWNFCSLKALPGIDQLYELRFLHLCNSRIRTLWNGKPSLHQLRIISLSGSKDLTETPDFSGTPNLESMFLDDCINLVKVHESLGKLKKLIKLSLKECKNLVTLPSKLEANSLEELLLCGCSKVRKLPEFGKNMKSLYIIDAGETSIREAPWSIIHLTNLKHFDLGGWHRLWSVEPKIPKNLFIYADLCLSMEPSVALLQRAFEVLASQNPHFLEGPAHFLCKDIFLDYQGNLLPTWFKQREYMLDMYEHPLFKKKKIRCGSVSIIADMPYNFIDCKTEWSAIAVCLVFEKAMFNPATWRGFSIIWKFKDYCHPSEERQGRQIFKNQCFIPLYIGFFPFDKKNCPGHPTGVGCQIGLTITVSKLDSEDLHWKSPLSRNLRVLECGWRLISKKDLDA